MSAYLVLNFSQVRTSVNYIWHAAQLKTTLSVTKNYVFQNRSLRLVVLTNMVQLLMPIDIENNKYVLYFDVLMTYLRVGQRS